jgi:hypothetical protein
MIIHLIDLPPDIYVKFGRWSDDNFVEDKNFLKKISSDFIKISPEVKHMSDKIGIPRTIVYKILSFKDKIRLEYLIKIADFLYTNGNEEYSIQNLENKIFSISTVHSREIKVFVKENGEIKRKLPFVFKGPNAIKSLTFPYTDGYILKDWSGYTRLGYVNSKKELHEEIIRCVKNVFGDVEYSQRKIKAGYETFFAGVLGKIYVDVLGFYPQNKVKKNPHLHRIITKSENEIDIGAFLTQLIDDEGSFNQRTLYIGLSAGKIPQNKKKMISDNFYKPSIQKQYMPNILKDTRFILKKINIKPSIKKPQFYIDHGENSTKFMCYLVIQGPRDLLKINSICKFKNEKFNRKFLEYVGRWKHIIKTMEQIEKIYGFLTVNLLKNELQTSMETARNIIRIMKRDGLIRQIKKGYYLYSGGSYTYNQSKFKLI